MLLTIQLKYSAFLLPPFSNVLVMPLAAFRDAHPAVYNANKLVRDLSDDMTHVVAFEPRLPVILQTGQVGIYPLSNSEPYGIVCGTYCESNALSVLDILLSHITAELPARSASEYMSLYPRVCDLRGYVRPLPRRARTPGEPRPLREMHLPDDAPTAAFSPGDVYAGGVAEGHPSPLSDPVGQGSGGIDGTLTLAAQEFNAISNPDVAWVQQALLNRVRAAMSHIPTIPLAVRDYTIREFNAMVSRPDMARSIRIWLEEHRVPPLPAAGPLQPDATSRYLQRLAAEMPAPSLGLTAARNPTQSYLQQQQAWARQYQQRGPEPYFDNAEATASQRSRDTAAAALQGYGSQVAAELAELSRDEAVDASEGQINWEFLASLAREGLLEPGLSQNGREAVAELQRLAVLSDQGEESDVPVPVSGASTDGSRAADPADQYLVDESAFSAGGGDSNRYDGGNPNGAGDPG